MPDSSVVSIPANPADSPLPAQGSPTGVVFNTTGTGFNVSENGHTGPSVFLFATADGTISGWSPGVDATNAIIGATNSGALYSGLAIATDSQGVTRLYAADFAKNTIDVYNQNFQLVTSLPGNFTDSKLPSSYSAFNIQAINNKLYVEYAPVANILAGTAASGEGAVDVYNADGQLEQRLIRPDNTHLNQPWAIAMAPRDFGSFSNDLLVGNFGNGNINAFNPRTGQFVGELKESNGKPIAITHLWGMEFGNGGAAGPTNTLYFAAGLTSHLAPSDNPFHGLLGSLQVASHDHDDAKPDSIMSSPTMPSSTVSPPNAMSEQQIDANFQEFDAVWLSLNSDLTTMHPHLTGSFAMLSPSVAEPSNDEVFETLL